MNKYLNILIDNLLNSCETVDSDDLKIDNKSKNYRHFDKYIMVINNRIINEFP